MKSNGPSFGGGNTYGESIAQGPGYPALWKCPAVADVKRTQVTFWVLL